MTTQNGYASTVNSFYLAFYGRPADPAGLAFWSKQLASANGELSAITKAFSSSEEAQTRFGSDTLNERITEIYQQLFNRAPDATGLAYWANAITSGNATLADVSIAILGGAQGTDKSLSTLRLQATDAFTAAIEAGGSGYSGYASIEAARVLVRAVTADSSAADLNALVAAAVSFADTATKNPSVVQAIASGSTLLALFDTARGLGDPVALAQALADTARAAAGDPVTLEQLLRGGGMAQVLKVMPASATLKDVVKALAEGGLPAAVEVVYPPAPAVPTPGRTINIDFSSVTQSDDDQDDDQVTNQDTADVTFSYTGRDLVTGQHFEFSLDGKNWSVVNRGDVDTVHNTVTISDLSLDRQQGIQGFSLPPDVTTSITMRAVQGSRVLDSTSVQIVYDSAAPTVAVSFLRLVDGVNGVASTSQESASALFAIDGPLGDGIIQYRLAGNNAWTVLDSDLIDRDGAFIIADIDLALADQTIELRLIDAAGNVGASIEQLIDGPASDEPPAFGVTPGLDGPVVSSNFAGEMSMFDGKDHTPVFSVDNSTRSNIGSTLLGAQAQVVQGTFSLLPDSGPVPEDNGTFAFALGSIKGDAISGQAVWGFDGDDIITSTSNSNQGEGSVGSYLFGGAGNDVLTGGEGFDVIVGGEGADMINLAEQVSEDDILFFLSGDTATGIFVDGGSTAGMDIITGFDIGDRIATPHFDSSVTQVLSAYLGASAGDVWAIVRGTSVGGTFTAGGRSTDNDYMVQWADDVNINSIIISNFGALTPIGVVDSNGGNLRFTLPDVVQSGGAGIDFGVVISAAIGDITGVANADGLTLENIASGSSTATSVMLAAAAGKVFVSDVNPGVYFMQWADGTFATNDGVMAGDAVHFAGGSAREIDHEGFEFGAVTMVSVDVESADSTISNDAYLAGAGFSGRIHTGGGHDAVSDVGGTMTIAYTDIAAASYDMIFGFDQDQDIILFENEVAQLIDKNFTGSIDWDSIADLTADTEAVALQVTARMTISEGADMSATANALNAQFSGGEIAQLDTLLILAQSANSLNDGALFFYRDLDNNARIDGNELTVIASFSDGMAVSSDIQLIGSVPG